LLASELHASSPDQSVHSRFLVPSGHACMPPVLLNVTQTVRSSPTVSPPGALVGFVRYYALMDQGSGASHVLGLLVSIIVCGEGIQRVVRISLERWFP
jgi:hypothetical protein